MATLTLRSVKGAPLTNNEIDTNFSNLNTDVGNRLLSSDYTASDILTKIKTVDGTGSGLDADTLDGLNSATANTVSTIVARDASGNFAAGTITATQFSGSVYLANAQTITFEGTDDVHETTLTVADPTADRTITLPNLSGTVVVSGAGGAITNDMLAGSITNDKLVNSSITIDGNAVSLGGSVSITGADLTWSGTQTFVDNKLLIVDNVDTSKKLALQISNISPSTTRTLTAPDESGIISTREYLASYVQTTGQNSQGVKTVSTLAPTGGSDGDIWYQV